MNDHRRIFTELSWLEIAHVFAELVGARVVVEYTAGYSCSVDYHYTTLDGTPCSYVYWLLFGKHWLTSAEKEYNGKIEEICARLDAKYAECVDWLSETARQSRGQYTNDIEEDMQVLHGIDIMPMMAGMIEAEFGINPFSRIHVGPGRFRVQMPGTLLYSEAKKTLDNEFDAMNLSEKQKLRAMKKVNEAERINGPEYEFALGGRSECFLLQTRLRETKYKVDEWRSPMDTFWH